MPSERIQRQIDRLLDEAEQAAGGGDWELVLTRSRHVLRLDPDNEDARAFLAAAGREPERPSRALHPSSPARDLSPDPFPSREGEARSPSSFADGRYQVKRFLGEGGKKRVYLAQDTLLDRDVAFALIKTEGLDDAGRDRIKREAQAMGRLGSHPHIVSVFDLGTEPAGPHPGPLPILGEGEQEERGQPYIVTELMGGGDVEGLIEKAIDHRPALERGLEVGIAVCRGLEFAHGHGIVHRDLKPGNVWLTVEGVAKLGDFGLAVALDRSRLTQAGMMVGTVAYMPPEQALGGEVTPQSDLYSLGAMLYELVTGRPPFVGDESVAIITQHLNVAPVAPSWHNPAMPAALEALILRLLEKDPAKRPQTAGEVRQALEGIALHPSLPASLPQGERGDGPPPSPLEGEGLGMRGENPMYRRTFVGREPELKQLQAAYDAATSGQGSLAVVVGEPGIGKTSVCEQLATYATIRGGKTLVGHCYEEGSLSLPYLPFVEAMRSYVLAREPDGLRTDLGSGAGEVARIVSELRERLHVEPSPANPADAEEERYRLFQAVSSFLRNAAAVQPLVIVLEDLHDADRGTLDLLVHLARNLAGTRLLLVGTYRDIEVDRAHPLSSVLAELRRGAGVTRLLLRGLTADEVQRMMSQLSGQEVPWRLAEAVHRQTEGNPLFIQEVLRYLVEERLIKREDGHWRRASEDTPLELGIPEGLRDVIGKRLSRLSAQTNQVLAVAAVMGREFRLDVLQRVAGLDEEALYAALAEAKAVAVVEERSTGASVSYRFTHAFFRQTLYEETIAPRRIRLHQQVARALEAVYGRRLEEHAAELAEHYAYSSDPADLAKAVEYGELAAQRALSVYAYGEAEHHLEQALKVQEVLDPDDKAKRCDLQLTLCEAMLPGEDPARVVETAAEQAFALAEALGDAQRAARVAVLALEGLDRRLILSASAAARQLLLGTTSTGRAVEPWIERADRYAADGTRERILADTYIGVYRIGATGPASGHPYLRKAAESAVLSDDQVAFFRAAGLALRQLLAVQDRDRVQAIADAVLRRPRQGVRSGDLGACLLSLGEVLLERGDRAAAEGVWEELRGLAERTGDAGLRVMTGTTGLTQAFLDGRLADLLSLAEQVEALAAELGTEPIGLLFSGLKGLVYLGHDQEVVALPFLANPRARPIVAYASWGLAQLGRHAEARALRQRFGVLSAESDETAGTFLAWLLESAVLGADLDSVAVLERRLAGMARFPCVINAHLSWARILGGAAALLGERDKARAYYERAIEQCTQLRNRPELALTHLQLAELLLNAGASLHPNPLPEVEGDSNRASTRPRATRAGLKPASSSRAGEAPAPPDVRAEALRHLDIAIAELRDMKMQPALKRALRHKQMLGA